MELSVIRLSERTYRDLRITTHCCLVARAFGAKSIILDEDADPKIGKTVEKINREFGGTFKVAYENNLLAKIRKMKRDGWVVVHLTMYGEKPDEKTLKGIRKKENVLIVIGSEKVPGEVYHEADYNISITRQPHSEVAALSVFMHALNEGKEEELVFAGARKRVVPEKRGKRVERVNGLNG